MPVDDEKEVDKILSRLQKLHHSPDLSDQELEQKLQDIMKELPSCINTANDFDRVFRHLPDEQRWELFDIVGGKLPTLINSPKSFELVFRLLSDRERQKVLDEMEKDQLPRLIHNVQDFNQVFKFLFDAQRQTVLDSIMDKLPSWIHTVKDFNQVFEFLSDAQRQTVLDLNDSITDKLPDWIRTVKDFNQVFEFLSDAQRESVFSTIQPKLSELTIDNAGGIDAEAGNIGINTENIKRLFDYIPKQCWNDAFKLVKGVIPRLPHKIEINPWLGMAMCCSILDDYLSKRKLYRNPINSEEAVVSYKSPFSMAEWCIFKPLRAQGVFGKSYQQKEEAVRYLKHTLQAQMDRGNREEDEKSDPPSPFNLAHHKDLTDLLRTLRDGSLGKTLAGFEKEYQISIIEDIAKQQDLIREDHLLQHRKA